MSSNYYDDLERQKYYRKRQEKHLKYYIWGMCLLGIVGVILVFIFFKLTESPPKPKVTRSEYVEQQEKRVYLKKKVSLPAKESNDITKLYQNKTQTTE